MAQTTVPAALQGAIVRALAKRPSYDRERCEIMIGRPLQVTTPDGATVQGAILATDAYQLVATGVGAPDVPRARVDVPRGEAKPFRAELGALAFVEWREFRALVAPLAALSCDAGPKAKRGICFRLDGAKLYGGVWDAADQTWGRAALQVSAWDDLAISTALNVPIDYPLIKRFPAGTRGHVAIGTGTAGQLPILYMGATDGSWHTITAALNADYPASWTAYLIGRADTPEAPAAPARAA